MPGEGRFPIEVSNASGMVTGRPQADEVSVWVGKSKGMTMSENPTMNWWIEVGNPKERLDCLRFSRGRPDADWCRFWHVSIEMPVGVTIKPKNSISVCGTSTLGFRVQSYREVLQDASDLNPMLFQRV